MNAITLEEKYFIVELSRLYQWEPDAFPEQSVFLSACREVYESSLPEYRNAIKPLISHLETPGFYEEQVLPALPFIFAEVDEPVPEDTE